MTGRALLVFAAHVYVSSSDTAETFDQVSMFAMTHVRGTVGKASSNASSKVDDALVRGIHDEVTVSERLRLLLELSSNGATNWSAVGAELVQRLPASKIAVGYGAYLTSAVLVASVIVFIYGNRGVPVIFGILMYLGANATIKLAVKWVFLTNRFTFPLFLTAMHFASGTLASGVWLCSRTCRGTAPFPWPDNHEFFHMLLPISLSVVVSIGAGNEALSFASAAFTEVISATGCLVTVAMVMLMGMPFKHHLLLPTAMVTIGCAVSVAGEMNFSLVALLFCFLANVARSTKVALQQNLMTGESRSKYGPVPLLFWTCLPSSFVMLLTSMAVEGRGPYSHMRHAKWQVFLIPVLASCIVATVLNMSQIIVTKDLGAVGSQLVAQAKTVLTVLGSVAVFGEHVTWVETIGFASVLLGVLLYSRWDAADTKKPELTPLCSRTQVGYGQKDKNTSNSAMFKNTG